MDSHAENTRRIAKNTLMLYIRMLFGMAVSLYTSRVVLQVLGVEDYGIYNVVGGLVTMFTLLSNSISTSISRFITFELGRGDIQNLKKVFSSSVTVILALSLFIIIVAEIVGVWFLNSKMNIPETRIDAAKELLRETDMTVSQVAQSVGFDDTNYFTRTFKRFVGISPKQY